MDYSLLLIHVCCCCLCLLLDDIARVVMAKSYKVIIVLLLDTCLSKPIGHSYPIDDLCSGYISCIAGRSYRACCDVNQRWISGSGCVFDPSCADACDREDSTRLVHPHGEYCLMHLKQFASLAISISILWPGILDIKRHSPSILYIRQTSRYQQAFSKPCLVHLISKDTHLVFSISRQA